MTPTEDATFKRRYSRLIKEGVSEDESERLCAELLDRDRTGLDMAVCLECKHLNKTFCQKINRYTCRFVLMRCEFFDRRI